MSSFIKRLRDSKSLLVVYISALLLSFHYALVIYINSSYLATYIPEHLIGLLYTTGAIANIIFLLRVPHYLKIYGNYRTILSAIILEMVALGGIAFSHNFYTVIFSFIIHQAIVSIILVCLDEFMEKYSKAESMGTVRGVYLTFANTAYVLAPFIVGVILDSGTAYWKVYMASFIFLLPLYFLIRQYFKKFKDSKYEEIQIVKTTKEVEERKDIMYAYTASFLLQFFYAWMVIYTPLYLHENVGFEWSVIGMIFSVMLLPFVIFELPVGRIEDKRLDEKEILLAGFVIAGTSTAMIPFIGLEQNIVIWMIVLFMTRVGASLIEVTSERYFFSHIKPKDSNLVSLFRMNMPLAYIVAPLVASVSIFFLGIRYGFYVLGFTMLIGSLVAILMPRTLAHKSRFKVQN